MSSVDGVFNSNYGLKPSEIDEINQSFQHYDRDNNGYITRDELKQCLKLANVIAVDAVVESVLKQMDGNHDGRISHGEYVKFMATVYRNEHSDLKRQLGNASDYVGSATGSY